MGKRPLFAGAFNVAGLSKANAGLYFDKYCDQWSVEGRDWSLGDDKAGFLQAAARMGCDSDALVETMVRRERLASMLRGESVLLESRSSVVAGMGRVNPTENGFNFHPTLGTFYLPGSSVKGVVSSYAEAWSEWTAGPDGAPSESVHHAACRRIFGWSEGGGVGSSVGTVAFLDALPISSPLIQVDVLTPHQVSYQRDAAIPGDWNDPVPIPFLSAATGARLHVILLPARATEHTAADLVLARSWLVAAAAEIGLGAKTAVGYGRFHQISSKEVERFRATRAVGVKLEPLGPVKSGSKAKGKGGAHVEQPALATDKNVQAVEATNDLNRLRSLIDGEALAAGSEWSAAALQAAETQLREKSDSKKDQRRTKALKKRRRELRGE